MGKITLLLTSLLVLVLFTTGIFMFVGNMQTNYNYVPSENFTAFSNAMNSTSLYGNMSSLEETFRNNLPQENQSVIGSWYSWADFYIQSFFLTVKGVSNTIPITNAMVQSSTEALQITWISPFVILIIGITIILLIWGYAVNREL